MNTFVYKLPDVGEGLDQAEIITWKIEVGSSVVPDQVLAEVETDKSVVEVPSPVAGEIIKLSGQPGELIAVGDPFVEIALAGEAGTASAEDADLPPTAVSAETGAADVAPDVSQPAAEVETGTPSRAGTGPSSQPRRILASPATRKRALDLGVDLQSVEGTGPQGRVTKEDVERAGTGGQDSGASTVETPAATAHATRAAAAREDEVVPLRGLRRQIAKNMTESWQQVPHITDFREVDATQLVAARKSVNEHLADSGLGEKITYLPFLVRAVTIALARSRKFNSSLDAQNEQITYFGQRNIGLAVSTDEGLFVPVVKDADTLSLVEIARKSRELSDKARSRTITSEEMSGGTFTITNFGSYGGWLGTPIIRPPEAAIAGFGMISDRVVPINGEPAIRPILPVAVSADHRVIDGTDMGEFLALLTVLLEEPVRMMAGEF